MKARLRKVHKTHKRSIKTRKDFMEYQHGVHIISVSMSELMQKIKDKYFNL